VHHDGLAIALDAVLARRLDLHQRSLVRRAVRRTRAQVSDQVGGAHRAVTLVVDLAANAARAAVLGLDDALERGLVRTRLRPHLHQGVGRDREESHDRSPPEPHMRIVRVDVGLVGPVVDSDRLELDGRRLLRRGHLVRIGLVVALEEVRLVAHPEDGARRVAMLCAARARDAHLLKLHRGLGHQRVRELVRVRKVTHGVLVQGLFLRGSHLALVVVATNVHLLANGLHRLLQEGQHVRRDLGLLLGLAGLLLLALGRHYG